jgi:hypothetical protein
MFDFEKPDFETMTDEELETRKIKYKVFNEGWWKGFTMAFVSYSAGLIVSNLIDKKLGK